MGTITKALNLLNHFSSQKDEISLSEFKTITGQDKATVYRHLSELEVSGMLDQNPVTKSYRLGPSITRLAAIREMTFPIKKLVAPSVDKLSKQLNELAHMSILQGDVMCPIYYADLHTHGTRISFHISEMLPLHATASGIAILSFGPSTLVEKIMSTSLVQCTPKTVLNHDELLETINKTREQGYSLSDQGFEIDVVSMAMPVFNNEIEAVGSISVALPSSRMNDTMKQNIILCLRETSASITSSLGGSIPAHLQHLWSGAV